MEPTGYYTIIRLDQELLYWDEMRAREIFINSGMFIRDPQKHPCYMLDRDRARGGTFCDPSTGELLPEYAQSRTWREWVASGLINVLVVRPADAIGGN